MIYFYRLMIVVVGVLLLLNAVGCGEPISEHKVKNTSLNGDESSTKNASSSIKRPISESTAILMSYSTEKAAFSSRQAAHFVQLALDCATRPYPNKIGHTMLSDADQGTPKSLHPAFYGCFDWHSSVHGHWLLARFARLYPDHPLTAEAKQILSNHLTPDLIKTEAEYLLAQGRKSWERPYGLVWLLQLAAELKEWAQEGNHNAAVWSSALIPLEQACVDRLSNWLPKLAYPIRTGEHSQTAFAFGLMLDYASSTQNHSLSELVKSTTLRLYSEDKNSNLNYEPSGQDFLSPILAEADLMRRVMNPEEFASWLQQFLPTIPIDGTRSWLPIATVTDRSDGKLAHLDGLNLSRAWMLAGIYSGLPAQDPRRPSLNSAAIAHKKVGLAVVTGKHYAGGHWLGTYAMYLGSGRAFH